VKAADIDNMVERIKNGELKEAFMTLEKELELRGIQKGREEGIQKGIQKGREEGIQKGIQKGREEGIQKGIQKGREEGIQKGREEGREEGEREKSIQIAKNLKKMGMKMDLIVKATGLSKTDIEKL
jgi:flagellar biosynthesis/type III secretory pathway protein FliH